MAERAVYTRKVIGSSPIPPILRTMSGFQTIPISHIRNRLYSMIEKLRKLSERLQDFKTVRVFVEQGTATELKT